ncbi:hypothetical protein F9802_00760 [Bacillus aerolatus]|uniref:DUF3679 domain-containing protein n=1 Tax=Bacillus aerolatus TaxID=2653354 RepID=A0A6I1FZA3_9BACI|nr:hypothetical protein [Bacillus aerolatus]KAB7708716.1 hypothetical protein F9802_00760 [Bacillus aerolatus]
MKIFLLKICLVVSIFFLGVLIGSFQSRDWPESSPYWRTASVKKEEAPAFSFFQQDAAEIDLRVKKEKLEEEESVNLFSKVGQSLAEAVTFAAASLFNG